MSSVCFTCPVNSVLGDITRQHCLIIMLNCTFLCFTVTVLLFCIRLLIVKCKANLYYSVAVILLHCCSL